MQTNTTFHSTLTLCTS